jgi:uncharacterized protein (DUF305 family)|tara:strand:+ start:944 stop:1519 length:576 start_codon:yes stop_codon:yes gene_type:complete
MYAPTNPNPCDQYLSDRDYLLHMIPHHQVAVDVSIQMQQKSNNPVMHDILRQLIWGQNREIMMMKDIRKNLPDNISSSQFEMDNTYRNTVLDFTKTASYPNAECNPMFFDPELHKKHMSHMKLDEKMYLEHMIPHHQIAVDMSKRLLKHTNNDFMIAFAYKIIRNQQDEINYMSQLLQNLQHWSWTSHLIN